MYMCCSALLRCWSKEEEERQRQQQGTERPPRAGQEALRAIERDQAARGAPEGRSVAEATRARRERGQPAGGACRRSAAGRGAACQEKRYVLADEHF